ncbi:MAG TPA: sulfurtransferase [Dokdonella sp.]|uniref:sulfurtransferase n=1 Tax=Dokdonella sp. TaxID=2291710 RepID=UPI002D802A70|nr:sulfurtransferase [Dokdonella sp.]HET9033686.1 sulfurtransferase [Dokdonella sp.]
MILNIAAYQFVPIDDPDALASRLREQAGARALLGSVLIAEEGINLFLAGADAGVESFVTELRADPRFADIVIKRSRSDTQPFARLKIRVKPEIISFRQAEAKPLARRAPAVSPVDLARWIAQGQDDQGKRLLLLDTRNQQEVVYGSFSGAMTLPIDKFTDLPKALAENRDALDGATVVSFCTGGIRCEKAALWMEAEGIENVYQLDGGILGYFEQIGGFGYEGQCFVFDERVALDSELRPLVGGESELADS